MLNCKVNLPQFAARYTIGSIVGTTEEGQKRVDELTDAIQQFLTTKASPSVNCKVFKNVSTNGISYANLVLTASDADQFDPKARAAQFVKLIEFDDVVATLREGAQRSFNAVTGQFVEQSGRKIFASA